MTNVREISLFGAINALKEALNVIKSTLASLISYYKSCKDVSSDTKCDFLKKGHKVSHEHINIL